LGKNAVVIDRLTAAILGSRVAHVASLLRRGAPVNAADKYGTTPLYKAAVQGETEIVGMLLEAGADPNRESGGEDEGTPLCAAASWGHTEIVRLLLQHGAHPNAIETPDKGVMTALEWAQRNGHSAVVQLLLEGGAHPSDT
jgi:ankyrin repeat protein